MEERSEALLERRALRQRVEIGARHLELLQVPLADGGILAVLEPAVVLGDLRAVVGVGAAFFAAARILDRLRKGAGGGERKNCDQSGMLAPC